MSQLCIRACTCGTPFLRFCGLPISMSLLWEAFSGRKSLFSGLLNSLGHALTMPFHPAARSGSHAVCVSTLHSDCIEAAHLLSFSFQAQAMCELSFWVIPSILPRACCQNSRNARVRLLKICSVKGRQGLFDGRSDGVYERIWGYLCLFGKISCCSLCPWDTLGQAMEVGCLPRSQLQYLVLDASSGRRVPTKPQGGQGGPGRPSFSVY